MQFDVEYEIERQEHELEVQRESYDSMPKILFKYKAISSINDLSRACDILQNNRIYMPTYQELNDPLEGLNSKLLCIDENTREELRKKWQILALSTDGLIPSLWAYYAGNYTGICIGFRTHTTFDDAKKVQYVTKQESISWDVGLSLPDDLLKKSKDWASEKEWRIIRQTVSLKKCSDCSKFFTFKPEDILCVFIGYKIDPIIVRTIQSIMAEKTKLFCVHPDNERYCLYAEDINTHMTYYDMNQLYTALEP
ncbi:MAG: DUF2971 domain-containing protein [Clostridia bacterium]|nr:DUF2971 domain-containing protein [Clostridia bacterium]